MCDAHHLCLFVQLFAFFKNILCCCADVLTLLKITIGVQVFPDLTVPDLSNRAISIQQTQTQTTLQAP